MVGRSKVLACLVTIGVSLKLSQHKLRSPSTCVDESKADDFYTGEGKGTKRKAPGNGKRVGEWRDMYPSWSFMLRDEKDTCMLKGKQLSSDEVGVQVVIDYNPLNQLHCCKQGETPKSDREVFLADVAKHRINHTYIKHTISETAEHAKKEWFYEVAVPEGCLPGGAKAPCPMLVTLHGMAMDHISHMALECSGCMDDMGVIALMLYDPDAVTHDKAGNFIIDHAWDSYMWLGEEYVRPITQRVLQEYSESVDTKRVYLYGLSMGGAGALMDAITEPDIFSTVYVVSPTSIVRKSEDVKRKAETEWKPLYSKRKISSQLHNIYIYQGGDDMNGDDIDWDLLPQTIKASGVEEESIYLEYHMFPELPHDCWFAAFEAAYDRAWKGA